MQIIPKFNPAAVASGDIDVSSVNAGAKILLYNLSVINIKLSFQNGNTAILHAGEANYFFLDGTTATIEWSMYSSLNTVAAISEVTGQIYAPDEKITGTYPMSLTYQLSVGNIVTTSQGASQMLVNDGNSAVPATTIVESTPGGSTTSAVTLTNTGVLDLGNASWPGTINLTGANSGVVLANGLPASLAGQNNDASVSGILAIDGSNNTTVMAAESGIIQLTLANGTPLIATVSSAGLSVKSGKLNLVTGGLTATKAFSGSGTGASQTITHGLGSSSVAPIPYYSGPFGAAPTQAIYVQNVTSTTFQVVAQSGFNWFVIAFVL
jgi:hypothetical protein